jgi:hypothetical protein
VDVVDGIGHRDVPLLISAGLAGPTDRAEAGFAMTPSALLRFPAADLGTQEQVAFPNVRFIPNHAGLEIILITGCRVRLELMTRGAFAGASILGGSGGNVSGMLLRSGVTCFMCETSAPMRSASSGSTMPGEPEGIPRALDQRLVP